MKNHGYYPVRKANSKPMGSFDVAEVCELIGLIMLNKITSPENSKRNPSFQHKTLDYIETTTGA